MANGTAVCLRFEPPPEYPSKDNPVAGSTIGAAVGDAVTMLCAALQDHQHGDRLDPEIREAGGIRVARLAEMWLAYEGGDDEFVATARQQGKVVLQQYLPPGFFQRYSAEQGGTALGFYVDAVVEVAGRVVRSERALRMAEAH